MPPGSNPVPAGRHTVSPSISIASAFIVRSLCPSCGAVGNCIEGSVVAGAQHRAEHGGVEQAAGCSRRASSARCTSSRVSGETRRGRPALSFKSLTSLVGMKRLHMRFEICDALLRTRNERVVAADDDHVGTRAHRGERPFSWHWWR